MCHHHFQLFLTWHTLMAELDGNALIKERNAIFFSNFTFFVTQENYWFCYYSICYTIFLSIYIKTPWPDQMEIEWINNNSVSKKKKFYQRKYLAGSFQYHWLIRFWQIIFITTMEIISNSKMKWNKNRK